MSETVPVAGTEPPGGVDYGSFSFTVKRFMLHQLAEQASVAVPGHATLPVLGCFQVTVSHAGLQVAATDMETTVIAATPAVTVSESAGPGRTVYIPARKLEAMLREAPEGEVTVTVRKNTATVAAGGASWVLKLPDSGGYPALLDPSAVSFCQVPREPFLEALRSVKHAVCRDAGRPPFTQVHIARPEEFAEFTVTASDSVRFARAPLPGFALPLNIPAVVLDELVRLLSNSGAVDVEVAEAGQVLAFRAGAVVLAVSRLAAEFPDMDRLVLKPALENPDPLTVDKDELLTAIRQARITADEDTAALALVLEDGRLMLQSRDKDKVSGGMVPVPADWAGGSRLLVVNHQFLADMVTAHPGKSCTFKVGKAAGKKQPPLLLADEEAGTIGVIPLMQPGLLGY